MLAKRIVPCLDVRAGRVVKGIQFQNLSDVNDPVTLAEFYSNEGADELVLYDITASSEQRNIFVDVVKNVARKISIPFTVGGGIRTIDDFTTVLRSGADKVSVNSAAVLNPDIIRQGALKFGRQCVVLSIDAKKNEDGNYNVFLNGGRKNSGIDLVEWVIKGEKLGAGEIVLNCMDTDGEKSGFSTDITKKISELVNVPVVASGGAGKMQDFLEILTVGKADAALAASVFHYGEIKISNLKKYLSENNVITRK